MIAITVITGTRPVPTIDNTISSLRTSGFDQKINISADPGAIIGRHDNVEIFHNKTQIGNCQQWKINMERVLKTSKEPWYMFVEDDILCSPDAKKHIVGLCTSIRKQIGFISAYTPNAYVETWPWLRRHHGWARINRGWNTWGCQCILMQRKSVELFSTAPKLDTEWFAIDAVLGEFFLHQGLDCYYAAPSLIEHVGLNNSGYNEFQSPTNCGLRFGDSFI